jgi:hypothetical protein
MSVFYKHLDPRRTRFQLTAVRPAMVDNTRRRLTLLPIAALPTGDARADPVAMAAAGTPPGNWQIRRLMEPTAPELAREMAGEVVIYDSLTDTEVEAAMSAHPERIRNMMFLGTIVTDDTGEAFFDPLGRGFIREDDGC